MARITTNGNIGPFDWKGGGGTFITQGTLDGATVALQYSLDHGVTKDTLVSTTTAKPLSFNVNNNVELYVDVSGGGGSIDFYLSVHPSEGAVNPAEVTGVASETTLATRASEDKQDLQIKRSFGGTAASDVYVVKSTGAKTFTFHGIQVVDDITLTSVTDSNLAGDSLSGAVLKTGYHPIAGTAIDCSAVGLAYLIGA